MPIRKAFFNKYHDEVTEAFKKYYRSTGMSIEEAEAKVVNTKTFTFVSSLTKALKYKRNKGITVTEDIDYKATDKAIRDSVNQSEYRKWIDDLFKGTEEKHGIWNGKDFYTPSGKARNFDKVIDKLKRKSDNNSKLVIVNLQEITRVSELKNKTDENSHQWLDENGWEYRSAYIVSSNGFIYNITLNIAKSRDGRNILYDVNNIKKLDRHRCSHRLPRTTAVLACHIPTLK